MTKKREGGVTSAPACATRPAKAGARARATGWAAAVLAAVALWCSAPGAAQAAAESPGDAALIRDVRPTKVERGDVLVVELTGAAPRGPAVIVLTPLSPPHPAVGLPARALGDGRVVTDVGAALEQLVGRDVEWRQVQVEVALTDTGHGAVWAETGGHRVWRTAPNDRYDFRFFPGSLGGFATRTAAENPLRFAGHGIPSPLLALAIMVAGALLLLLLVAPLTGVVVVWERKIAGRMQSRFGPNRVGPRGWLQWLADALKLITKEDLVPTAADRLLFLTAPYLMWMGIFATLVVLPLSEFAVIADMNVGLLYLSSMTTLTVIAIMMGGWASNSKWSILGAMRSAAQIISYELPASLSLLSVVVLAGTLSPQAIVRAQGGLPPDWFLFRNPFTFVAGFIYFIAALAEGNRTPFDLPEADSELVAGYHTEYSGFRWSIFQLAEWTNLYVIGAICATVFLGGWNIPFVSAEEVARSALWQAASAAVMVAKVVTMTFVIIWIRWSLPRYRVDQLMDLCWKRLLPVSFATFVASAGWLWLLSAVPDLDRPTRWGMFLVAGVGLGGAFAARLVRTFRRTRLLHVGAHQFTWPFRERYLDKR